MSKYAMVLVFSGIIPLILSFWPSLHFYRNTKALFLSIFFILVIFGSWDIFATYRGHWSFNPAGVASLRMANLPLEEALFFVVIPFCCIFTWEVLKFLKTKVK